MSALALVLGAPTPSRAAELHIDIQQFNRMTMQAGPFEDRVLYDALRQAYATERVLSARPIDHWYSTVIRANARLTLWEQFSLAVQLDTGEVRPVGRRQRTVFLMVDDGPRPGLARLVETTQIETAPTAGGQPLGDVARQRGFIREIHGSVDWVAGLAIDLGLVEMRIGDGFIFDGTALGGRVHVDFDALADVPLHVTGHIASPLRLGEPVGDGVVAEVRLAWRFSLLESLAVFAAGWWDGGSGFDDVHAPWLTEVAAVTSADSPADVGWISGLQAIPRAPRSAMHWMGASGDVFAGDVLISGRALMNIGWFEAPNPRAIFRNIDGGRGGAQVPGMQPTLRYDALGLAGDLRARWLINSAWMLEGFGVFLSGAHNPFLPEAEVSVDDTYGGFIGIAPLLTHTNLFFGGGINQTFNGRLGQTAGVLGHGALVGGFAAQFDQHPWTARTTAAILSAPIPSALTGGRLYGTELDIEGVLDLTDWLSISAEYDLLFGGDFWRSDAVIQRAILGLDMRWGDDV